MIQQNKRFFLFILSQNLDYNKMLWKILLLLLTCPLLIDVKAYQLGTNLIINSKFEVPSISARWQYFGQSILGWSCSKNCEINNCIMDSLNCSGQALDLTSDCIENVSQVFYTQAGVHLFSIYFLLPSFSATQKTILIYLNGIQIYHFTPTAQNNLVYNFTAYVYPLQGSNNLTLTMGGLNDHSGFKIISVSINRILDLVKQQIISSVLDNNILKGIISFPASRILLGEIVNTFISFDRLQLYYYHNRNYSYYTNIFFLDISKFLEYKGSLSLSCQKTIIGVTISQKENFINSLDYKQDYINAQVIDKSSNGYGFVSNNSNLVVYSIPFIILLTILFNILFRFTYNFKFSRIFRKYSYYGTIILLMISEGNIQQFSFYMFGEFNTFFSKNFRHKIVFFFIILFSSIGLYIWCWNLYKTKIWCITEKVKLTFGGIIGYTVDRGAICLLFGAVHQLLLLYPNYQLLCLAFCEIFWIVAQIIGLVYQIYKCKLLVWLNIFQGFLRIIFQLTLYIYTTTLSNPILGFFVNEEIHFKQILMFFAIWLLQFIVSLYLLFEEVLCSKKKKKEKQTFKHHQRLNRPRSKVVNFYIILKNGKFKRFYSKQQKY